ncbi:unnamed protein product, partial [marine sediment metagenome]
MEPITMPVDPQAERDKVNGALADLCELLNHNIQADGIPSGWSQAVFDKLGDLSRWIYNGGHPPTLHEADEILIRRGSSG